MKNSNQLIRHFLVSNEKTCSNERVHYYYVRHGNNYSSNWRWYALNFDVLDVYI